MSKLIHSLFVILAIAATGLVASAATVNVAIDTTPLVGHPAGPFSLLLLLVDGEGIGDGNNTVTMSGISFGSGTALGGPVLLGGAGGSLETGVTLIDTSLLSLFAEPFAPGAMLSFALDFTTADDAGGIPDRLTISILDNSGVPIPTLAPIGDFLLGADITSSGPVIQAFGSDPTRALAIGGPVRIVTPEISSIPEPGTFSIVGVCLAVIFAWLRNPGQGERDSAPLRPPAA
jgi:hypothetical protein